MVAWLKQMGHFKKVNFVLLVVGHTKNAPAGLFNSLKHEYCKKNLFTMQDFFKTLNVSDSVIVVPTIPEDFLDHKALTDNVYHDLSVMVKQIPMLSCHENDNDIIIQLWESNLGKHKVVTHKAVKRTKCFNSSASFKHFTIHFYLFLNAWG
jgi:hypothetical protein